MMSLIEGRDICHETYMSRTNDDFIESKRVTEDWKLKSESEKGIKGQVRF